MQVASEPIGTLKASFRAGSGYSCRVEAGLTLEQWELVDRIISDPDKIARPVVDQEGRAVGVAYVTARDLLQVEAHVDETGLAWVPPTAWAYFAACRARRELPADVTRLVVAARKVAFADAGSDEMLELDAASEAFADRVPWDDEPSTISRRERDA